METTNYKSRTTQEERGRDNNVFDTSVRTSSLCLLSIKGRPGRKTLTPIFTQILPSPLNSKFYLIPTAGGDTEGDRKGILWILLRGFFLFVSRVTFVSVHPSDSPRRSDDLCTSSRFFLCYVGRRVLRLWRPSFPPSVKEGIRHLTRLVFRSVDQDMVRSLLNLHFPPEKVRGEGSRRGYGDRRSQVSVVEGSALLYRRLFRSRRSVTRMGSCPSQDLYVCNNI